MSFFNTLRRILLWGFSVKEIEGFLTVSTSDDSITIELPFDPVDVDVEFIDEGAPPSCAPVKLDFCYSEKGSYSITVYWTVSAERKIRWSAAERIL